MERDEHSRHPATFSNPKRGSRYRLLQQSSGQEAESERLVSQEQPSKGARVIFCSPVDVPGDINAVSLAVADGQ